MNSAQLYTAYVGLCVGHMFQICCVSRIHGDLVFTRLLRFLAGGLQLSSIRGHVCLCIVSVVRQDLPQHLAQAAWHNTA